MQQANPNTVVVLSAGASLETPWLKHCRTLVYGALGGQAGAGAMLDVLTGKVNPSGKLAETWVNAYADTPAKDNFAGPGRMVQYARGCMSATAITRPPVCRWRSPSATA